LYSIEMPTLRETQRLWAILGVRHPVPEPGNKFWQDLWELTKEKLPTLQAIAAHFSSYGKEPTIQESKLNHQSITKAKLHNDRHRIIREMSGTAAIEECRNLGIGIILHPTNPGITAMRAKNALYARARQQHPPALADAA
jgi:hypothetical protein